MFQKFYHKIVKHWEMELRNASALSPQWLANAAVVNRVNMKVSGNAEEDPYQYFISFLKEKQKEFPLERCLTVGCGSGMLERGLSKYNFCKIHEGIDLAPAAIQMADEMAKAAGLRHLRYSVDDLNTMTLPADRYDAVLASMSLHHLSNLDFVFCEIRQSLKENGFLFFNEYVGPDRFQFTNRQKEVLQGIVKMLPQKYLSGGGLERYRKMKFPSVRDIANLDPSEAIHSSRILPALKKYFKIEVQKDYGGTLLSPLLFGVALNFSPDNQQDQNMLKALFQIEDALISSGELTSDFTVVIASPK